MHRVIIRRVDHKGNRIVEAGPWQTSRSAAEHWARLLQGMGYYAQVDSMLAPGRDDDDDQFAAALANLV